MSRPGWSRLYRWGRRWWLRMQQRALIVAYHRIAEPTLDPQLLCVSPQHFAEHLEIMTRAYAPLSLRALGQRVEEGRVPSRALVVTFDDGYADNLSHATPLLERYGVPATVFVVSGVVGPPREFWWDTLARLVLQPSSLPHHLRITVAGQVHIGTWGVQQLGPRSSVRGIASGTSHARRRQPHAMPCIAGCTSCCTPWMTARSLRYCTTSHRQRSG
jgi:peptidoglycan/xylan/chitin deacetylase (PgdA/CDA1 family)